MGGRIRHTEIAGTLIEIGAGFSHELNYNMLKYLGSQALLQRNFEESMKQGGVSTRLTHEFGVPTVRYIYHQSGERAMNGVSGGVSLWATDGAPIYSVVGGNRQRCERLVTASEAELPPATHKHSPLMTNSSFKSLT